MKGDHTFVQNQYGQDQRPAEYNDTSRGYGSAPQPSYGAVGNMGQPQPQQAYGHGHGHQGAAGQPIYVVDGQNRRGENDFVMDILLYVVALFLPPASVVVKRGCGGQFWLNIFLTILGFIPGLLHAWYIVAVTPGTYEKHPRR